MKKNIDIVKQIFAQDRALALLALGIIISAVIVGLVMALKVSPYDVQIATKYSSFDETQYYRNQWYYLFSFALFPIIIAAAHVVLMLKMYARSMRSFAYGFGFVTLILLTLSACITYLVFGVAYLS